MNIVTNNRKYQVGISSQIMNAVYAYQQKEYWCWTASITNILRAYGINNVSQEQFAQNICGVDLWGNACDCPATNYEVTKSLNFRGTDQNFRSFEIKAPLNEFSPNIDRLYKELSENKPVLVAYKTNTFIGHAVAVTGCECEVRNGTTYVTKLFIRGPSPDTINKICNGKKEVKDVQAFLKRIYAHWYVAVYKNRAENYLF